MKYSTAGESHGKALLTIVSDVAAGFSLDATAIDADLARRQSGYGRGGRMKIEQDHAEILSGVRFGKTLGTPIALKINNRDWETWSVVMSASGEPPVDLKIEQQPRPGHADLVGAMKIGSRDCRDVLERASARETAARVAAGAVAKAYLAEFGVRISSFVTGIGDATMSKDKVTTTLERLVRGDFNFDAVEASAVRCPDEAASKHMVATVDAARAAKESLGGCFVAAASGLVPGLGGYAEPKQRLTSRIGAAIFSIPAIKGLEFGLGFEAAFLVGSEVHDEIVLCEDSPNQIARASNNAGGLEGGMSNGQLLYLRSAMKPIPTLTKPLKTIRLGTHEVVEASKERSDVCAVPAAAVVAEAELAMVLADAYMDKFGRDDLQLALAACELYRERMRSY